MNAFDQHREASLKKSIVDAFHTVFYYSPDTHMGSTMWLGVPVLQNPMDLWMLQQVIHETEPDVIIETGSAYGGSALFYVSVFGGEVVSIDMQQEFRPVLTHERITFIKGDSVSIEVLADVRDWCEGKRVMVILDSDHKAAHVSKEMEVYSGLVSPGCYMIVCDTNIGGNPVQGVLDGDPGPAQAVKEFLIFDDEFEVDSARERFLLTFFPGGWLRKKQAV